VAEQSTGRVALMAIRPEFAEQILAGTKRVEFRKRPLAPDVTEVVVYASAPVSAVIGAFAVARQETRHPRELWSLFADVGGIRRARYAEYFEGRAVGTGIVVGAVRRLAEPIPLRVIGLQRPPQSSQYLPTPVARPLLDLMTGG
jgi:predicted transcriptional regulator